MVLVLILLFIYSEKMTDVMRLQFYLKVQAYNRNNIVLKIPALA